MAKTRWDIKRGANVYHQVSDARIKLWIKSGKIKAGEAVVWHTDLSGWQGPKNLRNSGPFLSFVKKPSPKRAKGPDLRESPGPGKSRSKAFCSSTTRRTCALCWGIP